MKKLLLLLLSVLPVFGFAQKLENSLLWKISGNGLKEPSYLFGTFHITCDAKLSDKVLKAMDNTSRLYLELDMDDTAMTAGMMKYAVMKDGSKLSNLASEEDYETVKQYIYKNTGIMLAMLDNYKPAIIEMMVMPKLLKCPIQSVELELITLSKSQGEEVYGLETIEEQMAVFDAIPYKKQMDDLVAQAKEGTEAKSGEFEHMMQIYKNEDLAAILEYVKQENDGAENAELLDKRNKNWIAKIGIAAKEQPTFFGVGAAHLPGDNGVINLLLKQGYKVEAVK